MNESTTQKFFELDGIKYVIFDDALLRIAIPFEENPQKVVLEFKKEQKKQGDSSFLSVFQGHAKRLHKEVIQKMPTIKQPVHFSFFVTSNPNVRGIMCASSQQNAYILDVDYPKALQVSSDAIKCGYLEVEKSIRKQVSGIHELVHVLHGGYFDIKDVGQICEGFAELVPFYLMDMEQLDEKHHHDILQLQKADILTLDFLNACGCFGLGRSERPHTVQDLRTYQSAYLWMMGYIKRVEKKYKCDKFKATEMILTTFANMHENWNIRSRQIADFVSMPVQEVFAGKTLQLEGQTHIADIIKDYYQKNHLTMKDYNCQPAEKEPLTIITDKQEWDKLGYVGVLFQNIAPHYLEMTNHQSPLTSDEQKLLCCIEYFQETFNLTKKDTMRAIFNKLKQYVDWDVSSQQKQEALIAWLLRGNQEKIAQIWQKRGLNTLFANKVLTKQKSKDISN